MTLLALELAKTLFAAANGPSVHVAINMLGAYIAPLGIGTLRSLLLDSDVFASLLLRSNTVASARLILLILSPRCSPGQRTLEDRRHGPTLSQSL